MWLVVDTIGENTMCGWLLMPVFFVKSPDGEGEEHGEQRGVLEPRDFERFLMEKIDETVRDGGYLSILFHPFLQMSEEKFGVLERGNVFRYASSCFWVLFKDGQEKRSNLQIHDPVLL